MEGKIATRASSCFLGRNVNPSARVNRANTSSMLRLAPDRGKLPRSTYRPQPTGIVDRKQDARQTPARASTFCGCHSGSMKRRKLCRRRRTGWLTGLRAVCTSARKSAVRAEIYSYIWDPLLELSVNRSLVGAAISSFCLSYSNGLT